MKRLLLALAILSACSPVFAQQASVTGLVPQYASGQLVETSGANVLGRATLTTGGYFTMPLASVPTHYLTLNPVAGSPFSAYSITVVVSTGSTTDITQQLLAAMPSPLPTIFPAVSISTPYLGIGGFSYRWPLTQTSGCLTDDGSGNLSWGTCGGGGGAVASVFGRTGSVTAQSGDYTAAQVGADASGAAAAAQAAAISAAETFSSNASNITSGTIAAARVPTLNQSTTGTAGGLTGNPSISLSGLTVVGLSTGCLQSTSGVVSSTGVACGSGGGGSVASVFGRTGAITAQTGDYTYSQVGADQSGAAAAAAAASLPLTGGTLTGAVLAPQFTAPALGTIVLADGYPASGTGCNSVLDCAVAAVVASGNTGVTIQLGNADYCTYNGVVEPSTGAPFGIRGPNHGADINGFGAFGGTTIKACGTIPQTALNPSGAVFVHAAVPGGFSPNYSLYLGDVMIDPNGFANQAVRIEYEKIGYMEHVLMLEGNAASTLPTFQLGSAAPGTAIGTTSLTSGAVSAVNVWDVGIYGSSDAGTHALMFSGGCGGTLPTGTYTVGAQGAGYIVTGTSIAAAGSSLVCAPTVAFNAPAVVPNASGYQFHYNDVFIQKKYGSYTAATVTRTITGGVPSFTVTAAGTYHYPNPSVVWSEPLAPPAGSSMFPCTTMGTITPTMSGSGSSYTLTGLTATGFAGCVPSTSGIYNVIVNDQPAAQYAVSMNGYTDESGYDMVVGDVGTIAAINHGSGSNTFVHDHPIGNNVGIIDLAQNTYLGYEPDTLGQFGAEVYNSNFYGTQIAEAVSVPAFTAFYGITNASYGIFGNTCPHGVTLPGWALAGITTGQIAHPNNFASVLGYQGSVVGGLECDTQVPVNNVTALNLQGSTFGNGWSLSSAGAFSGSLMSVTPNATPTSGGTLSYVAQFQNVSKYIDAACVAASCGFYSDTMEIIPHVMTALSGANSVASSQLWLTDSTNGDSTFLGLRVFGAITGANFQIGGNGSGINGGGYLTDTISTTASGTTVVPTSATSYVTGTSTVLYMTPNTNCTLTGFDCTQKLIGAAGANVTVQAGTGVNQFSVASTIVAGLANLYTFDPSTQLWMPTGGSGGGGGNATSIGGVAVTGTPSAGQVLTATSPTAADWQTVSTSAGTAYIASGSGIDPTGATDSYAGLQAAINAGRTAGLEVYIPAGTYKVSAGLTDIGNSVFIRGAGAGTTRIYASATGYTTLQMGPQTGTGAVRPNGSLKNITIDGAYTGVVPPTADHIPAFQVAGAIQFDVENAQFDGADIAVDGIDNNYGWQLVNIRAGFAGDVNAALNLRTGAQSGSDITIINPWITGTICGACISGNGGGYHFFGGQIGAGGSTSAANDSAGAVILGQDYISGATGETTADFHGVSFENANFAWVFRNYDQARITVIGSSFNPSSSSEPAIGVYKGSDMKGSQEYFDGNIYSGNWSGPNLVSFTNGTGIHWDEHGAYMGANAPKIAGTTTSFCNPATQSGNGGSSMGDCNFGSFAGINVGNSMLRYISNQIEQNFNSTGFVPVGAAYNTLGANALAYYSANNIAYVSPVTPFSGVVCDNGTGSAPGSCTTTQMQTAIGSTVYSPYGAFTGDVTKTATGFATTVTALNGTSLAGLATGILANTTGTGVPSIYTLSGTGTVLSTTVSPTFTTPNIGSASGTSLVLSGCLQNGTSSNAQICANSGGPTITTNAAANSITLSNQQTTPTAAFIKYAIGGTTVGEVDLNDIVSSKIGASVASAATVAPTGMVFPISGSTTITTITVPPFFTTTLGGCLDILSTGTWGTGTGGNVNTTIAATVSGTQYRACWWGTYWTIK